MGSELAKELAGRMKAKGYETMEQGDVIRVLLTNGGDYSKTMVASVLVNDPVYKCGSSEVEDIVNITEADIEGLFKKALRFAMPIG